MDSSPRRRVIAPDGRHLCLSHVIMGLNIPSPHYRASALMLICPDMLLRIIIIIMNSQDAFH